MMFECYDLYFETASKHILAGTETEKLQKGLVRAESLVMYCCVPAGYERTVQIPGYEEETPVTPDNIEEYIQAYAKKVSFELSHWSVTEHGYTFRCSRTTWRCTPST